MLTKWALVVISAVVASGCVGNGLPPSVWPPPNFLLVVEEMRREGGSAHVVRRLQVDSEGVLIYGTSSRPLVDEETGMSLPVFDRLSICRLEPKCLRALARGLDRLGIGELVVPPLSVQADAGPGLSITWRAFEEQRALPSIGRLRGPMAEIMAVISSHLPPGEAFDTVMTRPVVPILSGVPVPGEGAAPALVAYGDLLEASPDDEGLVLAAYALACTVGDREQAQKLLEQWVRLQAQKPVGSGFRDDSEGLGRLLAESLAGFLPRG